MKIKFCIVCLIIFLATTAFSFLPVAAQTSKSKITETNAVKKLRELYFKRDFENCAETGKNLAEKMSVSVEAKAWTISCQARIAEQREDALKAAQSLTAERGENAWTWFALANAQIQNQKGKDAQDSIEKALAIEPDNEEFIFTKSQTLSAERKYDEAENYLEQNSAKIKDKSRTADTTAIIFYNRSKISADKIDDAMRKQSFDNFAEAVKLAPRSVDANSLYGQYLNSDKRYAEAYPFLKTAVSISSRPLEIHKEFWKNVESQKDKTEAWKNTEIEADINNFLTAQKNSPAALFVASQKYGEMNNSEKRLFYENQILQKYDDTKYAEEVLYSRIHTLGIQSAGEKESQNKIKAMRWEYINRTQHFDENKLGDVYFFLLEQLKEDRDVTDADFAKVIAGALKYRVTKPLRFGINDFGVVKQSGYENVNSKIALIINSRRAFSPNSSLNKDAEKYARDGIDEAEEKIKESNKPEVNSKPLTSNETTRSIAKGTLGTVLLAEGKYDEAKKVLLEATDLDDENFSANASLARLYMKKNDYDKAEEYYLRNAVGSERDRKIFSQLYEKSNGNLEGFENYFVKIKEKITSRKKEKILASRIKKPKDVAPFDFKTIDDKTISFADLKGKIIVINVWGTWCSPCVAEMPQLQQLYKKYENDKDVAIITMDTNDELETVKKFIADKKYEFPVLLGDSYAGNIMFDGNITFPTTLFIDKQGKIAFVKVSRTENLLDEFGWRIEVLKADK